MSTTPTRRRAETGVPSQTATRADRAELAISAESDKWASRPHIRQRPRFRSLLVLVGILGLCALIAVTQVRRRLDNRDRLSVSQVVLTADPIVLESAGNGHVVKVDVTKGAKVIKGQTLATVEYLEKPGQTGGGQQVEIFAPTDGIVTEVWAIEGLGIQGSTELVSMYEPSKLYFRAPMTYGDIAKIDLGSHATMKVPGMGNIDAVVTGVQADFGEAGAADTERLARLVLKPADPSKVLGAAPGVIVKGEVDKHSPNPKDPKVLFGNGGTA